MLAVADRVEPEPCAVRVRRHGERRHRLLGKDGPCSLWSGALVLDSEAAAKARALAELESEVSYRSAQVVAVASRRVLGVIWIERRKH
jgi:hypothetical protein